MPFGSATLLARRRANHAFDAFLRTRGLEDAIVAPLRGEDRTFGLLVVGTGFVSGNGFDVTPGSWSFTSTQSNGGTSRLFSFAANTTAGGHPAPDSGSTVALLGAALMTVAALRAKFRG